MAQHQHAFVLSGGGALAAYEVGVMKALLSSRSPLGPVEPSIYSGTSAGAVNAAAMIAASHAGQNTAIAHLEDLWRTRLSKPLGVYRLRGNVFDFMRAGMSATGLMDCFQWLTRDSTFMWNDAVRRSRYLATNPAPFRKKAFDLFDLGVLFDSSPLEAVLRDNIDVAAIANSPVKLFAIATNWSNGEARIATNADCGGPAGHAFILASAAIPGIFPAVVVDGEIFLDGGVIMNTPLKPSINAGADTLHVIHMDAEFRHEDIPAISATLSIVDRALAINTVSILKKDMDRAAQINRILDTAKARGLSDDIVLELEGRPANSAMHCPVTIHRYRPDRGIGGLLQALDFSASHIEELIEMGYKDGMSHDCKVEQCVLHEHTHDL